MLSLFPFIWILSYTISINAQPPPSCKSTLLSSLPDSAFSASSNVAQKFSASAAKMSPDDSKLQYRAWCPENVQPHEEKEYLEVDFGRQSFVKLIITKGLSTADKGGLYLTPFYYIWYRRGDSNSRWIKYQNVNGTTLIKGNLDAQTERYVSMNPPFVARWIRIYPFTQERQPVCLKLEIVGCSANGVIEYQAPRGNFVGKPPKDSLIDVTYDNPESRSSQALEFRQNLFNVGGLGKLTDGKPDHENDVDPLDSNEFVGWKRADENSEISEYERVVFRFDRLYNFTGVNIYLANIFGIEISRPRMLKVRLSRKFPRASSIDPATTLTTIHQFPPIEATHPKTEWIHVDFSKALANSPNDTSRIYDCLASFVELRLYYGGSWLAIGEVTFDNTLVELPPGLILDNEPEGQETKNRLNLSQDRNSSAGIVGSQHGLITMQPHTYALVVGLGCLATVLIILVLSLFVHWRRRALLSKHKMDEINHSFQIPFTMPLIKTGTQQTSSQNTDSDHKWDYFNNSSSIQVPMYLNRENVPYTSSMPHFLMQQQGVAVPNSLILPNYMRTQLQSNQCTSMDQQPLTQDRETNSGEVDNRPSQMFPFFQSVSSSIPSESNAVYTTVSEADAYVNGTPRPNQMLHIPPPPSMPLPPTPTQTRSVAAQMPPWPGSAFPTEKDYMQHREISSNGSSDVNAFYRYSVPLNGAYPATPIYSAPIWVAGAMDPGTISRFYGQQHQQSSSQQDRHQETPELNDYLSGTPVSSIIYGGFYGARDTRQGQSENPPGSISN
nr:discoidin domain containing receptor 2 [Hymenolepis microstoma]